MATAQSRRCVCPPADSLISVFPTPGCQKWGMRIAYIRCERTGWTLRCRYAYRLCCPYREKVITDANYEGIVAEGLPVVLDFSATWCGPCKKIGPIISELAEEYDGRVNVGKCDVDDNDELTAKFGIRNVPTVLFIKNGEVVDKHVGAGKKAEFVEKIENLLK